MMAVISPATPEAVNQLRDLLAVLANPKKTTQTLDDLAVAHSRASEALAAANSAAQDLKDREERLAAEVAQFEAAQAKAVNDLRDREVAVAGREQAAEKERRDLESLRTEVTDMQADATAKLQRIEDAKSQFAQQLQAAGA